MTEITTDILLYGRYPERVLIIGPCIGHSDICGLVTYSRLYEAYSSKGRKSKVAPSVLFQVIAYAYQCGIYSSRKIEEACRYRVDFLWLLDGQEAPDHATIARFRTGRCKDALEDLFYQLVAKLENMGEVDHQTVFIDGTKIERQQSNQCKIERAFRCHHFYLAVFLQQKNRDKEDHR